MVETQTGAKAPDFTVVDAAGRTIRLADYAGKKNVVLVFNRGFG
jgi:peroxiredoxin